MHSDGERIHSEGAGNPRLYAQSAKEDSVDVGARPFQILLSKGCSLSRRREALVFLAPGFLAVRILTTRDWLYVSDAPCRRCARPR